MISTRALVLNCLLRTASSAGGITLLIAALIDFGLIRGYQSRLF
jgi:hypothetical protein